MLKLLIITWLCIQFIFSILKFPNKAAECLCNIITEMVEVSWPFTIVLSMLQEKTRYLNLLIHLHLL